MFSRPIVVRAPSELRNSDLEDKRKKHLNKKFGAGKSMKELEKPIVQIKVIQNRTLYLIPVLKFIHF